MTLKRMLGSDRERGRNRKMKEAVCITRNIIICILHKASGVSNHGELVVWGM
jgi:hypothetical protein